MTDNPPPLPNGFAAPLGSTMPSLGGLDSPPPQITFPSTADEQGWRKFQQRKVLASRVELYPNGIPPHLSRSQIYEAIRNHCLEKGVHDNGLPSERTIRRCLNGR